MRRSGTHFLRVFAEKFKRNILINFSDVTGPLVDFLLGDKAPARMSAIGHCELDPFKRNFAATGDIGPCHVEDGLRFEDCEAVKADLSFGRPLLSQVEVCVSVLFFGLAPLAPVPALVSTSALSAPWAFSPPLLLALMALAISRVLWAPWALSLPLLLGRGLSADGLAQMVRLIVAA